MSHQFTYLLIIFICKYNFVESNNEATIKDIPVLNSSIACSKEKPLNTDQIFGYIETPKYDGHTEYEPNLSCSWRLTAKENHIFSLIARNFVSDSPLYVYNGFNESHPLLKRYFGQQSEPEITSSGNIIFLKFVGSADPFGFGFQIYFKQKPIPIQCNANEVKCRNGYKCVEHNKTCNGFDDCGDGSDEQNCTTSLNDLNFKNSCGKPQIKPIEHTFRIVGGFAAKPGSWPWMADMRILKKEPEGHQCGASLLNRQWIVTAAHCFIGDSEPEKWRIHFGKYRKLLTDTQEVIRYIDKIIIHPNFRGGDPPKPNTTLKIDNDIALVKLNAPIPYGNSYISSVCLPKVNEELKPKDMLWVTGWGATANTGNELVLKQTQVPLISNEVCDQWMPYFHVVSTQMCTGFEEGGQDSCKGDSGGPLVRKDSQTDKYSLYGIVSANGECGGKKQAGIQTLIAYNL